MIQPYNVKGCRKIKLKVSTFNIRTGYADDGTNSWAYRKNLVLRSISENAADILGSQETIPSAKQFLRHSLPQYTIIGENRDADRNGESSPIAFKTAKFELLEAETFWLSENPSKPGSTFENSDNYPRVCTALTLRLMDTGKMLRVLNTHLDYLYEKIRIRQIGVISEKLKNYQSQSALPLIITGDFNAFPKGRALKNLVSDFPVPLSDATTVEKIGTEYTYHGFFTDPEKMKIDYILVSNAFHVLDSYVDKSHEGSVYVSDHYPVFTLVEF